MQLMKKSRKEKNGENEVSSPNSVVVKITANPFEGK